MCKYLCRLWGLGGSTFGVFGGSRFRIYGLCECVEVSSLICVGVLKYHLSNVKCIIFHMSAYTHTHTHIARTLDAHIEMAGLQRFGQTQLQFVRNGKTSLTRRPRTGTSKVGS